MISLKVEEGPDRVGRSVGLFSRIHWRVEVGRGILNYQSARQDLSVCAQKMQVRVQSGLSWTFMLNGC